MKQLKIFALILLIALSSCVKNNDDSSVVGDVIVVSKMSGTNVVYALAYYAYAFSNLKSVSVVSSLDATKKVSLAVNGSYKNNFYKEPADAEYSATKPTAASYTFNSVFESGETYVSDDIVTSAVLAPVTFSKCAYNSTQGYAEFTWAALTDADSYAITIYDDEKNLVFKSAEFTSSIHEVTLSSASSGWASGHPSNGKTYTVRVSAYQYEDNSYSAYDVQATSISESNFVWGN